jgi:hypothetical protein
VGWDIEGWAETGVDAFGDFVVGGAKRGGRMVAAGGRAFGDIWGASADLMSYVVGPEEQEGLWEIIRHRGAELAGNVIGPKGVMGEVIEAIPEPVREDLNNAFETWDDAYRWVSRYPTAALNVINISGSGQAFSQGNPLDTDTWRTAWRMSGSEAGMTVGQAMSFVLFDIDVLDEYEIAHWEGTQWHNWTSGLFDTVAIVALDPTVIGGKAVAAARGAGVIGRAASRAGLAGSSMRVRPAHRLGGMWDHVVAQPYLRARYGDDWRTLRREVEIARRTGVAAQTLNMGAHELLLAGGRRGVQNRLSVMAARREHYFRNNGQFDRLVDRIDSLLNDAVAKIGVGARSASVFQKYGDEVYDFAAQQLRDQVFYKQAHGAIVSQMLVRSYGAGRGFTKGGRAAAEDVMRFFLGDMSVLDNIAKQSTEAANYLKGLVVANGVVHSGAVPGVIGQFSNTFRSTQAFLPVDPAAIADEVGLLAGRAGVLDRLEAPSFYRTGRSKVRESQWYINGTTGGPMRLMFDKVAHRHVLFADVASDLQIDRMLRQAKMDPNQITKVKAHWNSLDEAGRRNYWDTLIGETMKSVIRSHFPNVADAEIRVLVKRLVEDYGKSARHAQEHFGSSPFAHALSSRGDDFTTIDVTHSGLTPERLKDSGLVPDFSRLHTVSRRARMTDASTKAGIGWATDGIWKTKDGLDAIATHMMGIWKAEVLINPKWPMRVVGEESLGRLPSIIGAPDAVWNALVTGRRDYLESVLVKMLDDVDILDKAEVNRLLVGLKARPSRLVRSGVLGLVVAGPVGATVGMSWSAVRNGQTIRRLSRKIKSRQDALDLIAKGDVSGARAVMEAAGYHNLDILGMNVSRAYGNPMDALAEWENAAHAGRAMEYVLTQSGRKFKEANVQMLGDWKVYGPPTNLNDVAEVRNFAKWWNRVANDQFGRSEFSRLFWNDAVDALGRPLYGDAAIVKWLETTKAGRGTIDEMGWAGYESADLLAKVQGVRDVTERILPNMPELSGLRRALANGKQVEHRQVVEALERGPRAGALRVADEASFLDDALRGAMRGAGDTPPTTGDEMWEMAQDYHNDVGMGRASGYTEEDIKHFYLHVEASEEPLLWGSRRGPTGLKGGTRPEFKGDAGSRAATVAHNRKVLGGLSPDSEVVREASRKYHSDADHWDRLWTGRSAFDPYAQPGAAKAAGGTRPWNEVLGKIHKQEEIGYDGYFGWFKKWIDRGFNRAGALPTNAWSRNPLFKAVYSTEMSDRLLLMGTTGGKVAISPAALRAAEDGARITALQSVRHLMYDLAESSRFAEATRHFLPFFNAWQEVLTRWAGIVLDNPAHVARLGVGFRTAGGLPTATDSDGNRHVVLAIPDFAKDLINSSPFISGAFDNYDELYFNVQSINMITQGLPGFSPVATITAGEFVKKVPEMEEMLDFLFPFGMMPSSEGITGLTEQVLRTQAPAWVRPAWAAIQTLPGVREVEDAWDDRSGSAAMQTIAQTWLVQMHNGDRPMLDFSDKSVMAGFWKDVEGSARSSLILMTFAKLFSPAAVRFVSPYQDHIDHFRELRNDNINTADDLFREYLAQQGLDGFFALSSAVTRSREGLPPTLEAHQIREKYVDLFLDYPELGGLILGMDGGGLDRLAAPEWSPAVYEAQQVTETYFGSGETQRERLSRSEFIEQSFIREGWSKYRELQDLMYAELDAQDLPNFNVKEAEGLRNVRRMEIEEMREQNPLWAEAFDASPRSFPKRLEGMRVIVDDERFANRVDIQLLGDYLDMRDVYTGELAHRAANGEASGFDAGDNADLRAMFEAEVDQMVMENPTFSDVWLRWLEFDTMSKETWPEDQQELAKTG